MFAKLDEEAKQEFEGFYHKYERCMFLTALNIFKGNRSDAEEVVQETFLSLMQYVNALRQVDSEEKVKAYLIACTRHQCFKKYRESQRNLKLFANLDYRPADSQVVDPIKIAEEKQLYNLLNYLKDDYRVPMILHLSFDWGEQEIAQVLHITYGNVRQRILRGRRKLRNLLREAGWER